MENNREHKLEHGTNQLWPIVDISELKIRTKLEQKLQRKLW